MSAEGATSNLFAVRRGMLLTLPSRAASWEVFVTASTIEVLPVVRLGRKRVGAGVPGPIARLLQERYRRAALRACTRARSR